MEFDLDELTDIWLMAIDANNLDIIQKIEMIYMYCPLCSRLIPVEDSELHFDSHDC